MYLFYGLCGFLLGHVVCRLIRLPALSHLLIDVPNERSSHTILTPRGAGIAFLSAIVLGFYVHFIESVWMLAIGFVIVGVVGILEDLRPLPIKLRLAFQAAGAFFVVVWFLKMIPNFFESKNFLQYISAIGVFLFYTIASINFFNFADGINGYVGLSSLFSIGSLMVILPSGVFYSFTYNLNPLFLLLSGSLVAFLIHNFILKRVFMGDVGSTLLGLTNGLVAGIVFVYYRQLSSDLFWLDVFFTLIIVSSLNFFIFFDSSAMLFAKLIKRFPLTKAHRGHLYQILANEVFNKHEKATLVICTLQILLGSGLFWLNIHEHLSKLEILGTVIGIAFLLAPVAIKIQMKRL